MKHEHIPNPPLPYPVLPLEDTPSNQRLLDINDLVLDETGMQIKTALLAGRNVVVAGQAGTGKTALTSAMIPVLIKAHKIPLLWANPESYYTDRGMTLTHSRLEKGDIGFAVVSLARRAVQNYKQRLPRNFEYMGKVYDLSKHVMTYAAFMEYLPDKDSEGHVTGWKPTRGMDNPFPPELKLVIFEEAGMLNVTQFRLAMEAIPHDVQIVIQGDLGQVAAIGGLSILGAGMAALPYFELTKIHRHVGDIITLARSIREKTTTVPLKQIEVSPDRSYARKVYPDRVDTAQAANVYAGNHLFQMWENGMYVPGLDLAVCPQHGKQSDTTHLWSFGIYPIWYRFAMLMDVRLGRYTYYIRTRANANVIAHGDILYLDLGQGLKEHIVVGIVKNPNYAGVHQYEPQLYSTRDPQEWRDWYEKEFVDETVNTDDLYTIDEDDLAIATPQDFFNPEEGQSRRSPYSLVLVSIASINEALMDKGYKGKGKDAKVMQAITALTKLALSLDHEMNWDKQSIPATEILKMAYTMLFELDMPMYNETVTLVTSAAQIGQMLPPILTVHKVQGIEGRIAHFIAHRSCHMLTNEMVYTAITRAVSKLMVLSHKGMWESAVVENVDSSSLRTNKKRKTEAGVARASIAGITAEEKSNSCRIHIETKISEINSTRVRRGDYEDNEDFDTEDILWVYNFLRKISNTSVLCTN